MLTREDQIKFQIEEADDEIKEQLSFLDDEMMQGHIETDMIYAEVQTLQNLILRLKTELLIVLDAKVQIQQTLLKHSFNMTWPPEFKEFLDNAQIDLINITHPPKS